MEFGLGNYEGAAAQACILISEARIRHEQWSLQGNLWTLAACHVLIGDPASSREAAREALSLMAEAQPDIAYCAHQLSTLALVIAQLGAIEAAGTLAGFCINFFTTNNQPPCTTGARLVGELEQAVADGVLTETARSNLMAKGATLSSSHAIALAVGALDRCPATPPRSIPISGSSATADTGSPCSGSPVWDDSSRE